MNYATCGRALLLTAVLFGAQAWGQAVTITLPAETAELKASPHPGRVIALQKCAICHSVDYINLQPGHMTLAQWTAEVTKMQRAYAAPLSDDEVQQISGYLASAYGDASAAKPDAVKPASPISPQRPQSGP